MSKAIKAQLEVKTKCDQVQRSLKDLYDWEQEMKQKEAQDRQLKNEEGLSPPVRSHREELNKFTEDQNKTEKKQYGDAPISVEDIRQAEQCNERGNNFYKGTKEGEGISIYKEKHDQNAIDLYTNAIQLNGFDASYYVNRALCYFNLERYEECISDCDAAIKLDKNHFQAFYRRMKAYEYMGKNELAYSECQTILKMTKDAKELTRTEQDKKRIQKRLKEEADKYKVLGNKHLSNKDYEKALGCFARSISLFGDEAIYYHNRSLCYFHLKDYENSLQNCNKAIEIDQNYFRPYYQRMRIRELRCEYAGAIADCKKFLTLVKDDKQRSTAGKDLERLQRTLEREQQPKTYNWSESKKNTALINFVQKPPNLRSKKPLKRILISEVAPSNDPKPKPSNYVIASNYDAIPDSVIDKIFNNNTGERMIEPKEESNLENLFPSSSMSNKLKNLFSPPASPISPHKTMFPTKAKYPENSENHTSLVEPKNEVHTTLHTSPESSLRKKSTAVVIPAVNNYTQASLSDVKNEASSVPFSSATKITVEKSVSQVKEEKDKTNQGHCAESEANGPLAQKTPTSDLMETNHQIPSIPSSTVRFYHDWYNMKTLEEKYQYLKTLQDTSFDKLLGANISNQMLSEVFQILERYFLRDNCSPLRILSGIAKNPQVGLLVMMLDEKDKSSMVKLLDFLDTLAEDKAQLLAIRKGLVI